MDDQEALLKEIKDLRARLVEAEETLEAIRTGGVDALVVNEGDEELIYMLQGAEHPYRVMVETINEGAATLSEEGVVIYANTCLADMCDTPLENVLGSPLYDFVLERDRPAFEAILEQGLREKCKTEVTFQARDGWQIPVQLSLSPLQTSDLAGVCVIATDLSQQKRNEEILAAERMANSIIQQAGEAIIVCDADGKIIRANQVAHGLAGQNPLFKPFSAVFPLRFDVPSEADNTSLLHAVMCGDILRSLEARLEINSNNPAHEHPFSLLVSATPLIAEEDEILGCVISMADMTKQKKTEQALRESKAALQQTNIELEDRVRERTQEITELQRRLIDSIEDERQRVSKELHDGPMQEVYGLIYSVSALTSSRSEADLESSRKHIQGKLQEINTWLRDIVQDLRPTSLIYLGLEKGIREHANQFTQEHPELQLNLELQPDGQSMPENVRLALFRIYRGALTNVIRHAHAQHVDVRLKHDSGQVILEVQDDGRGFIVPKSWISFIRQGHLGLAGAAERAEAFGGKLEVKSRPDAGTLLKVITPLNPE